MKIFFFLILLPTFVSAQTWVDSLNKYALEKFMPSSKYIWSWQKAPLLRAFVDQYTIRPKHERDKYLDYVKKAMKVSGSHANGKWPNGVASGHGMAFLWRITKEKKYKKKVDKIYRQYLKIPKTEGNGISHLPNNPELWDDTIYMIGVFLMEMYRATNDEQYLTQLMEQIRIHRDKLQHKKWGLWVHGWDANNKTHLTFCGCRNWPEKESRKSTEIWGRGNGWIVIVLSDAIKMLPKNHIYQKELRGYLKEMIIHLPMLQDKKNGHWKQLPTKPTLDGNFIESSSTAMFAYGILTALQHKIVIGDDFEKSIDMAYKGLREYSIQNIKNGWLTTKNVCIGTCIGNENYYLKRKTTKGKAFAIGPFITFGMHYEIEKGIRK